MKYCLLTGATGLLGRYLLRFLLQRGFPLAVLTRGNRTATARQRVETVILEMEEQLGCGLPRPVLLTGDLSLPELGLSRDDRSWVRRRVGSVLHNAASLTFEDGAPNEEPWKTNLTGTQTLVEAARDWGIREFHHVSTAYVCGLRRGVVRENELAMGQRFGNDYEHSKFRAEQLVQQADCFDSRTIYRPAIIVGDSQTGYSNTFHGFYTPLRIVHMLINSVSGLSVPAESLVTVLGLSGAESKNLVPVDWVAAVIGHLFTDRRHHGHVYHITPEERTSASMLCDVMSQAVERFGLSDGPLPSPRGEPVGRLSVDAFLNAFREKMKVYQAYWRDDPEFDATERLRHAGELSCPRLTHDVLLRLCEFAIRANFWTSRGDRVRPDFDINEYCARFPRDVNGPANSSAEDLVQLRVTGCGGGDWVIRLMDSRPVAAEPGLDSNGHLIASLDTRTFQDLVLRRTSVDEATRKGRIAIENCARGLGDIGRALDAIFIA